KDLPPVAATGRHKLGAGGLDQKLPNFGDRACPFLLAHHWTSFDLVQIPKLGWRLAPTLKPLFLSAGVNWTRQAPKGAKPDSSDLVAKARSRYGQVVLDNFDEYGSVEPGAPSGYFLDAEKVTVYRDGTWSVETDHTAFDTWRWGLVTSGRIDPPRAEVIARHRTRLKKQVHRATKTPHLAAAQEAKAAAEALLAGLEDAVKALKPPDTKAAA
ncbi:MAG TPA: hypothetical protein VEA41_18705, partial [Salinarimonas sp.]|nr:hypothetical protein [Salinarimonas sp.]